MEISKMDMEKIRLITLSAQVNDLVVLACNIDREGLSASINSVMPEDRATVMYKFLVHAADFKDKIEAELQKGENQDDQLNFNFQ